jgi:hypothetical protein
MADPKQAAAAGQRPLPTMKKEGYAAPSPAAKVLTRQDATLVIAQEVRRMATTITRLQEEREELRIKVSAYSFFTFSSSTLLLFFSHLSPLLPLLPPPLLVNNRQLHQLSAGSGHPGAAEAHHGP